MPISVFDLFSIGIGPSSSHSVGPMRAARRFAKAVLGNSNRIKSLQVRLYGSLALTGKGHGSDKAILLGLSGEKPAEVDPEQVDNLVLQMRENKEIKLLGKQPVHFDEKTDLLFLRNERLPLHSNGIRFTATTETGETILEQTYYSIGGGFVLTEEELKEQKETGQTNDKTRIPFPFDHARDLLELCKNHDCSISSLVLKNEKAWRSENEIREGLLLRWEIMQQCVKRGCEQDGILPGGLKVKRRAAPLYRELKSRAEASLRDPLAILDWVDLYALAVNEENAAGGRVVTAPTNGAAGIIPAVLHYFHRFCDGADGDAIVRFFLTAGAIGMLYKKNASISGAEVGCQGEVGVASSMAAGALTEVLGGSIYEVEQAAEIGMEHNLGLTCDPIGGLVQVPCIERNAMGAVKAINASRIALREGGEHRISLDRVIETMRRTGADMNSKYKETSRGGLAVNVTEC